MSFTRVVCRAGLVAWVSGFAATAALAGSAPGKVSLPSPALLAGATSAPGGLPTLVGLATSHGDCDNGHGNDLDLHDDGNPGRSGGSRGQAGRGHGHDHGHGHCEVSPN